MGSLLQKEVSRIWLVAVLAIPVVAWLIWDSDLVYAHRHHLDSHERLYLDFDELTSLTPGETQAAFPVHLQCLSQQTDLGDSFCASWLQAWNDIHAMNSMFFYADGRLLHAKVDVPWWHHDELIQYLKRQYGEPDGYFSRVQWGRLLAVAIVSAATKGQVPVMNTITDELGVWRLKSGGWLVVNVEKDNFPLQWSTVFWMSPEKVRALTGDR